MPVDVRQAFEDARALGTASAWKAFLKAVPEGFYADLAKAYLERLEVPGTTAPVAAAAAPAPQPAPPPAPAAAPAPALIQGATPTSAPSARTPAILRGAQFLGFPEQFNRYYTDPTWRPRQTLFVSADGSGDGSSREAPMAVASAFAAAKPGTLIKFSRGSYRMCTELTKEQSGTYDDPVVLYGERNADGSLGVAVTCCDTGRKSCINLEGASYVAVDGFELIGGSYGVRSVGTGYAVGDHARGLAVLSSRGHDQERDPFLTNQVDWSVWEDNIASGAKKGDGHGFYLNGDWSLVRRNETFGNASSDFQINADPASACEAEGIPYDDPRCDAYAGEPGGGQGASDYFLIEDNYFHHGTQGANFTSVRRSLIRNNIFGLHTPKHNVSFWQETDNPKLGSRENKILHNLFVTTGRPGVQFQGSSTANTFADNVLIGVKVDGGSLAANPSAVLMEVDDSTSDNIYRANVYISGRIDGRSPNAEEKVVSELSPAWFSHFPLALNHVANDFGPAPGSPVLDMGDVSPDAPVDRNGVARQGKVAAGPIEGGSN